MYVLLPLLENAPGPPANVVAEAEGSSSIRIHWQGTPSKNGHPTMAYTVHYVCVCNSEMGRKGETGSGTDHGGGGEGPPTLYQLHLLRQGVQQHGCQPTLTPYHSNHVRGW